MPLLVAAVVVLTVITALHLLLTSAMIRMLRDRSGAPARSALPGTGTRVTAFSAEATDGEVITDRTVSAGAAWVGVLSPGCAPCRGVAELIAGYSAPAGPDAPTAIAFVLTNPGEEERARTYAAGLGPAVRTVLLPAGDPVLPALGCDGTTPSLLLLRDGVVTAAGHRLAVAPFPTAPLPVPA